MGEIPLGVVVSPMNYMIWGMGGIKGLANTVILSASSLKIENITFEHV